MKSLIALGVLAAALMTGSAQEGKMELTRPGGDPAGKKVISQRKDGRAVIEQKRLEFDGFLSNLVSSNKLIRVFDLTAPVLDPVKEKDRVVVDEATGRTIGFKLLTIRFGRTDAVPRLKRR
jgi:hypothetical protein